MDEDAATAAGQLLGSGPAGVLVVDSQELLSSTARVVNAELGEMHLKIWMALVTLHVIHGMPEDGRASSTIGEIGRLVWGEQKTRGGSNTDRILETIGVLDSARLTIPGYDPVARRPAPGIGRISLFSKLYIDDTLMEAFLKTGPKGLTPEQSRARYGKRLGAKTEGTIAWQLDDEYVRHLATAELRRFDWTKAQKLRKVALALWMIFSSPRFPYRPVFGSLDGSESVELPLTVEHCNALGVRAGTDSARRRTINEAGPRVCDADPSFVAFEAHGGRGVESFLRVTRQRPTQPALGRPYQFADGQLVLDAV